MNAKSFRNLKLHLIFLKRLSKLRICYFRPSSDPPDVSSVVVAAAAAAAAGNSSYRFSALSDNERCQLIIVFALVCYYRIACCCRKVFFPL